MSTDQLPPPRPAPDPLDDECLDLLAEPFASAWQVGAARPPILRERVLERVTRSARASSAFVTVRCLHAVPLRLAAGVEARTLYDARGGVARPGEPARVRIVELAAGARWLPDLLPGMVCEWLVMDGAVRFGDLLLRARDFHRLPADAGLPELHGIDRARLYLREAPVVDTAGAAALTVHDDPARWDDFAPGIKRRVLWSRGGEAALLYHALPDAQVPRHGHGHDEECLMLDGEVFLDDVLLRAGDYQLAPAGTQHGGVSTDTGGLLFAHGDLDLDIRAE
ncbi:cupin domain-containing protein [Aquincola sp. S2]|uniref:Cupin domain-containing protein n=1 Tax=Pseudaquabacterium terrae TaxID=2732868 RepID=A0ABX2EAL7_9BURK|nr:cupin domain-containing protein [Aquabacterium terrae]NRF66124.1 cupin domain-containing protein [Aquabacterium terrae]